jgi:hypothetical protein
MGSSRQAPLFSELRKTGGHDYSTPPLKRIQRDESTPAETVKWVRAARQREGHGWHADLPEGRFGALEIGTLFRESRMAARVPDLSLIA